MKKILVVLLFSINIYALNDYSAPVPFTNGSVIYASEFNENEDTTEAVINSNNDTIETKFVRFTDLTTGDSTLTRLQIDTATIDTAMIKSLNCTTAVLRSSSIDSGYITKLKGNMNVNSNDLTEIDSIHTRTVYSSGAISTDDSLGGLAIRVTGDAIVANDVIADSAIATTGARVTNDLTVSNTVFCNRMDADSIYHALIDTLSLGEPTLAGDIQNDTLIYTSSHMKMNVLNPPDTIEHISGGNIGDILVFRTGSGDMLFKYGNTLVVPKKTSAGLLLSWEGANATFIKTTATTWNCISYSENRDTITLVNDLVAEDQVIAEKGIFDSIQIGGGAWVTKAEIGGFVMIINNGADTLLNDSAYYYVFNDNVSLSFTPSGTYDAMDGSLTSWTVSGLPASLIPATQKSIDLPYNIAANSTAQVVSSITEMYLKYTIPNSATTGTIQLNANIGFITETGSVSARPVQISYSLD